MSTNPESIVSNSRKSCPTCGLQLESQVTVCPRDGTQVGVMIHSDPAFEKYEFLESIGAGGMGVIYKARHRILNKVVAIKTLHSHLISPESLMRFQIEGKATSSLQHPSIINIQDFGLTEGGQAFMVMDYVPGKTLADILRLNGQLPVPRFLDIFIKVCDGLSHAHERSVLHRDIKPGNIMLFTNEHGVEDVRVMDFGIAKIISDNDSRAAQLTKTGEAIGSPMYMSPEQGRGDKTDQRSDLYSLGCVMYECLTGSPPFEANSSFEVMLMHLEKKPTPIREASIGNVVDPRLERLVMRLLEKSPQERYQTMEEVKQDLLHLKDSKSKTALPSESHKKVVTTDSGKQNRFALAATIAILCGCVLVAAFWLAGRDWRHVSKKVTDSRTIDSQILDVQPVNLTSSEASRFIVDDLKKDDPSTAHYYMIVDSVKDADLRGFASAPPTLKNVYLENTEITDKGLQHLKTLSIEHLDLSNTRVATLEPLKNMPSLNELILNGDKLTPEGFKNLGLLTNLTRLQFNSPPANDFRFLKRLPGLKELELSDSHLSKEAAENISKCQSLKILKIDRSRVDDFSPFGGLTNLTDLQLNNSHANQGGWQFLAHLRRLERLKINKTDIKSSDLVALLPLGSTLKVLEMGDTDLRLSDIDRLTNNLALTPIGFSPLHKPSLSLPRGQLLEAVKKNQANGAYDKANEQLYQLILNTSDEAERVLYIELRADGLTHLHLPITASRLYEKALNLAYKQKELTSRLPSLHAKRAASMEMMGQAGWYLPAIKDRVCADQFFRTVRPSAMAPEDGVMWDSQLQQNLDALRNDFVQASHLGVRRSTLKKVIPTKQADQSNGAGWKIYSGLLDKTVPGVD